MPACVKKLQLSVIDLDQLMHTFLLINPDQQESRCRCVDVNVNCATMMLQVGDLEGILEGLSDSKHTIQTLVTELLPSSRLVNDTDPEVAQLLRQIALILQSLTRVSC